MRVPEEKMPRLLAELHAVSKYVKFSAPGRLKFMNLIDKTVDLFSRIKSTDQAEEVATLVVIANALRLLRAGA